MRAFDEDTLRPADFEESFVGEPSPPPAGRDLARARGRLRKRRLMAGALGTVMATLVVAVVLGQAGGGPTKAVPVAPPSRTATTPPIATVRAAADTAPPLKYDKKIGYLDSSGRTSDGSMDGTKAAWSTTTRNTYELVRRILDPEHQHLEAYDASASTGGGGDAGVQVGQKLGWSTRGDPGQGMLLVTVARPAPGVKPVVDGPSGIGLCAGGFVNLTSPCAKRTIAGHEVWFTAQDDGGFVMDEVQPDGEVAGIVVSPLFGNNTDVSLRAMNIGPTQAVTLLSDARLDVVG